MTTHTHDPATRGGGMRLEPATNDDATKPSPRPRWLLPGLAAGIVVSALVVAGVLSFSTVLYAGLLGGMLLIHMGGHGGHGGPGGQDGHGSGTTPDIGDLRTPSSGAQVRRSGSSDEIDDGTLTNESRNETDDHDKHSSHGCH